MRILYLPNCYSQQRQRERKAKIYPVLMASEAEWYRKQGHQVYWIDYPHMSSEGLGFYGKCNICGEVGSLYEILLPHKDPEQAKQGYLQIEKLICERCKMFDKVISEPEGLHFLSLPHPDRVFTRAKEFTSGNYKYLPGTHMQCAEGCVWGKCTFCVEQGKSYEVREVDDCIEEIKECKALGFREVFDDSGTFPMGDWLDRFCDKLSAIDGIRFGCNMRMVDCDWSMLRKAGFRMVLFGLESANQPTLDKINKGVQIEKAIEVIKKASRAGLEPHIAVMFGYHWESDNDANNTLRLVHYLLKKGFAKTAQASFYSPQTGEEGKGEHRRYIKRIYDISCNLEFWFNKLRELHDRDDLVYLYRQIKAGCSSRSHTIKNAIS